MRTFFSELHGTRYRCLIIPIPFAHCHRALKDEAVTEVQRETVFRIYCGILKSTYGEVVSSAGARMGMDLLDGGRAEEVVRVFRARGIRVEAAREILAIYWPER